MSSIAVLESHLEFFLNFLDDSLFDMVFLQKTLNSSRSIKSVFHLVVTVCSVALVDAPHTPSA